MLTYDAELDPFAKKDIIRIIGQTWVESEA